MLEYQKLILDVIPLVLAWCAGGVFVACRGLPGLLITVLALVASGAIMFAKAAL